MIELHYSRRSPKGWVAENDGKVLLDSMNREVAAIFAWARCGEDPAMLGPKALSLVREVLAWRHERCEHYPLQVGDWVSIGTAGGGGSIVRFHANGSVDIDTRATTLIEMPLVNLCIIETRESQERLRAWRQRREETTH